MKAGEEVGRRHPPPSASHLRLIETKCLRAAVKCSGLRLKTRECVLVFNFFLLVSSFFLFNSFTFFFLIFFFFLFVYRDGDLAEWYWRALSLHCFCIHCYSCKCSSYTCYVLFLFSFFIQKSLMVAFG